MRQGLLLDLLFRTPSLPPNLTLLVNVLAYSLRLFIGPLVAGKAVTSELDEALDRTSNRASSSGSPRRFKNIDTRNRLFGGRSVQRELSRLASLSRMRIALPRLATTRARDRKRDYAV